MTRHRAKILSAPAPLAAVALLVVNDHLLKGAGLLPEWLTGKLSDFAGLFFFPLLLTACAPARWDLRSVARGAALATAIVFAALKLSPELAALVPGRVEPDLTDWIALPMVLVAWRFAVRGAVPAAGGERPGYVHYAGILAAAIASMATSAPARPPEPPPAPGPIAVASGCHEILRASIDPTAPARLAVDLHGSGCTIGVRRAVLTYDGADDIHVDAVARDLPPEQRIAEDADLTLALGFDLPYPYDCARPGVLKLDYASGDHEEVRVSCDAP